MQNYYDVVRGAADFIAARVPVQPEIGLVLGSGWDMLLGSVEDAVHISYADVPGMSASTVPGHAGEWVFGRLCGRNVAIMSGRSHYYEGHDLRAVTLPVRIMQLLGVKILMLTNAAGAINTGFQAGDLMLITDHINMTANSPLIGPNDDRLGTRFPDMSRAYDRDLIALARKVATEQNFAIREGVYAQMTGPSFETPAEIRMLRTLGADAVGMSTVPEVVAARHGGMRVLGVSCMTNMAAGVLDQPLSHAEVLETAARVREPFRRFMFEMVRRAK